MEMERINENLIKVYINVEDLEERGINFLDLISDQKSVEKFFYSILEEVDVERQFYDSEAITFQVIPSNDGIELYISRSDFEDIDSLFDEEVLKRIHGRRQQSEAVTNKRKEEPAIEDVDDEDDEDDEASKSPENLSDLLSEALDKAKNSVLPNHNIVRFEDLDGFIKFAREQVDAPVQGDLYYMNKHYYFVITNIEPLILEEESLYTIMKMKEFGEGTATTVAVLEEYGELIRQDDTLAYFGKYL